MGLFQCRDDQERGVRAGGSRLEQLVFVDEKSFRSSGMLTAARTADKCPARHRRRWSVSTEIAAARHLDPYLAIATGS